MRYRHEFRVRAPLARVAGFHRRAESLAAITPPWVPMRFAGELPEELSAGDEMAFRMWLGPVPVRWRARIEAGPGEGNGRAGEESFVDRQLEGPFAEWVHVHRFVADGDGATRVRDEIDARLPRSPLRALVALAMWLGLPVLFAYRGWKTRRLLEGS